MEEVKMKPILFSTDMVIAIKEGRKRATRRVIKFSEGTTGRLPDNGFVGDEPYLFYPGGIKRPKYKKGDILWVRETWCELYEMDGNDQIIYGTEKYYYAADNPDFPFTDFIRPDGTHKDYPVWKPSIYMPKEAARIFLKVTDVRVEKLQDITSLQIIKEGAMHEAITLEQITENNVKEMQSFCFAPLWDSIRNKKDIDKYGWNANPWVWVIEFERHERG